LHYKIIKSFTSTIASMPSGSHAYSEGLAFESRAGQIYHRIANC